MTKKKPKIFYFFIIIFVIFAVTITLFYDPILNSIVGDNSGSPGVDSIGIYSISKSRCASNPQYCSISGNPNDYYAMVNKNVNVNYNWKYTKPDSSGKYNNVTFEWRCERTEDDSLAQNDGFYFTLQNDNKSKNSIECNLGSDVACGISDGILFYDQSVSGELTFGLYDFERFNLDTIYVSSGCMGKFWNDDHIEWSMIRDTTYEFSKDDFYNCELDSDCGYKYVSGIETNIIEENLNLGNPGVNSDIKPYGVIYKTYNAPQSTFEVPTKIISMELYYRGSNGIAMSRTIPESCIKGSKIEFKKTQMQEGESYQYLYLYCNGNGWEKIASGHNGANKGATLDSERIVVNVEKIIPVKYTDPTTAGMLCIDNQCREETICDNESFKCFDGTFVYRNKYNNCEFDECPNCEDTEWTPSTEEVCEGKEFIQTSNCGNSRIVTGTKKCEINIIYIIGIVIFISMIIIGWILIKKR